MYLLLNCFTVSGASAGDVCGSIEEFLVIFNFIDKTKQDERIFFSKSVKRLFLRFSLSFLLICHSWEKAQVFFFIICQFK